MFEEFNSHRRKRKLTPLQIEIVEKMYKAGLTQKDISDFSKLRLDQGFISRLLNKIQ